MCTRVVEVVLSLDHAAGEPLGEEVPEAFVPAVEGRGVEAVQAVAARREIGAPGTENDVIVRCDEAEGMALPGMSAGRDPEQLDERLVILTIAEDRPDPTDAASENMEEPVRKIRSPCLRHSASVRTKW